MTEQPFDDHSSVRPSHTNLPRTKQSVMLLAHLPLTISLLVVLLTGGVLTTALFVGSGEKASVVTDERVRGIDVAAWRERVREVVVATTDEERERWAEENTAWAEIRRDASEGRAKEAWGVASALAADVAHDEAGSAVRALVAHADRLAALSAGLDVDVRAGSRVASSGPLTLPEGSTPEVDEPLITESDPSGAGQSSRTSP